MNVLLISERTFKTYSVLGENVNPGYIYPAIIKAQDMGLEPLIGSALMNKLAEVATDGGDESYQYLITEYIHPYLINRTMVEIVWAVFAKIRNSGVVTSQDQQTAQMSIGDCELLRKKYENDAAFYAKRLTEYLCCNTDTFPEYAKCGCCGDKGPTPTDYSCNIVL